MNGVVDLTGLDGDGPLWGIASADLNATLLAWPAGHQVAEHVNAEVDVLVVVVAGTGTASVDGHRRVSAQSSAQTPMRLNHSEKWKPRSHAGFRSGETRTRTGDTGVPPLSWTPER